MWSRVLDVVSSSLIQFIYFTASGTINFFLPHRPFCLPEGIYSPFSTVLYNVSDVMISGKTDKQFMPQEYSAKVYARPTRVCLNL